MWKEARLLHILKNVPMRERKKATRVKEAGRGGVLEHNGNNAKET
jgi:hypothetical protein